jgi:tRNA-2-methylthio-N6-dimethylallyladenosine synthase
MKPLTVYCESYGCQMNAYDTEVIASLMEERGHTSASSPDRADVIIVNTCSVREHAEQRVLGRLLDLSRHRDAVLVVCGCMAQRMGHRLFDLVPSVRGIAGTDRYAALPEAIAEAAETGSRFSLVEMDDATTYELLPAGFTGPVSRYVSITRGCENYCSYCIVPYLRGKVRSRAAASVVEEVASLVAHGAKEITLLGQNVIAYRDDRTDFLGLVNRILDTTEIRRIRFLTSHPRDITVDVFKLMARDERFCSHIHLPVQSGSTRILEAMNRGYTREKYLATVHAAREAVRDIAITTDIIVGFPSESQADFRATLDLVHEASFDSAFTFAYSPRSGTAAGSLPDDVPPDVKKERLHVLNDAVQDERERVLRLQLGAEVEILLDGAVQKGEHRFWKGRTPQFRNVIIADDTVREGDIVRVVLRRIVNFTFEGELVERRHANR